MTQSNLLIDIGNSNTQYVQYQDLAFTAVNNAETNCLEGSALINSINDYDRLIIASVVPQKDNLFDAHKDCVFINHTNIPIITPDLDNNQEIGADRLVNSLGAYVSYNNLSQNDDSDNTRKGILIVDSGTALTFCYITKEGVYKGGIILPGLKLSSLALTEYTAKIPLTYVSPTDELIGRSTKEAVEIGLYQGFIHMINGFIAQYKQLDPELIVVGTGKGLEIMKDKLKLDVFDQLLIHKGLAYCADHL